MNLMYLQKLVLDMQKEVARLKERIEELEARPRPGRPRKTDDE